MAAYKKIMTWSKKPPENKIAMAWINSQQSG